MKIEQTNITLVLPISPSVNDTYGMHCVGGFPKKYVKTRGKSYFLTVQKYVETNGFDIQANVPLSVEIIISFATHHRNDLDNRLKSLLDSLTNAGVWEDDSLINEIHVVRGAVKKPGSIIINIKEYKDDTKNTNRSNMYKKLETEN